MFQHLRMNLAYKKIIGKFTKVLGFGKPPPPCWEKIPNDIVFFFESVPYYVSSLIQRCTLQVKENRMRKLQILDKCRMQENCETQFPWELDQKIWGFPPRWERSRCDRIGSHWISTKNGEGAIAWFPRLSDRKSHATITETQQRNCKTKQTKHTEISIGIILEYGDSTNL